MRRQPVASRARGSGCRAGASPPREPVASRGGAGCLVRGGAGCLARGSVSKKPHYSRKSRHPLGPSGVRRRAGGCAPAGERPTPVSGDGAGRDSSDVPAGSLSTACQPPPNNRCYQACATTKGLVVGAGVPCPGSTVTRTRSPGRTGRWSRTAPEPRTKVPAGRGGPDPRLTHSSST